MNLLLSPSDICNTLSWGDDSPLFCKVVMDGKRIIAVCQAGGEFEMGKDGSLLYKGGDAHAIEVDDQMGLNDLKKEIAEMYDFSNDSIYIKYFLPGNKRSLVTITNDQDLKFMVDSHSGSVTTDVYVTAEESVAPNASETPASRSSGTMLSEVAVPADSSFDILDDVTGDSMRPGFLLPSLDVLDESASVDDHIDTTAEISTIIPLSIEHDEKPVKAAEQWQTTITGVGQRFNSVHDFREALRKYAIAHRFAFRYKKNDSHRVTVKCKAEGCPWRIHASRLSTTPLICIKKMHATHTCEGVIVSTGYQATRSWVASIIKEKLRALPNYKPKDIVNDIKQEYGIQLNYFQAWRGKEIAKEQLQGSYKEAYKQLPCFCEKIVETNPGSFATFSTKEDSSFHRLFISFHASLFGFQQGCRPLLFLDSIALKLKYQGTLLTATAADGDDAVFPVAFAVVDAETDDNWRWFLVQLKSALPESAGITFVADREKGLKESISQICGSPYHGYCLRYLTGQFIRELKGQLSHEAKQILIDNFYSAACAPQLESFERHIESIKSTSVEAYNWVLQSEPLHWANAYFQGARYNHLTSNFGELFYSWASDAHELPITQMVDVMLGKIMELIYQRRSASDQWLSKLIPSVEAKLEGDQLKAGSFQVLLSGGSTFEVRGDSIEIVNIDHLDCTCKGWQLTGLPCCHAIAVIGCIGQDPADYCSPYFTAESYRLTYSELVHCLPECPLSKNSSQDAVIVTPPPTRRPPGRPTMKKFGSQEVAKRQLQCSRCRGVGHNKSSCKELL